MLRRAAFLVLATIVVALALSPKAPAWGGFHAGFTHYGPITGFHQYGPDQFRAVLL